MPRVGNQHFPYTEAGYAAAARAKKARGYQTGGSVGMSNPFEQIPPFTGRFDPPPPGGGINPNNMFTDPNHPLYGRFQGDTAASFRDQLEKIMKNRPTAPRPPGQGGDYYPQPLPPRSYGDDMRNIPFIPGGGDATGQNPPPSKSGGIFGQQYVDDPELNRLYNQLKMTIASGGGVIMQTPEESAASSQAQRQLEQQIIAAGGKPYQYFTRLPHGGFTEGRGPRPGYDPMTGAYPDNINQKPQKPPAIPDFTRPELPDLFGNKSDQTPSTRPPSTRPPSTRPPSTPTRDELERMMKNIPTSPGIEGVLPEFRPREIPPVYDTMSKPEADIALPKTRATEDPDGPIGPASMPPGFTTPSSDAVTMALVPFYNPTTGESWTATTGGYSPAPGWVEGTKENYKASAQPPMYDTTPKAPEPIQGMPGVVVEEEYMGDIDPNAKAFPNAPMGSPRASLTNAGLAYLKRTGQPIPGEAPASGGADLDPNAMAFPDAQPGEPGYGLTNYGLGYMRRKGQQIPGEAPPPQADTPPPTPPQARNYGVDRAGKPLTEAAYNWIISRGGKDLNNDGRINSQELEAYHTAQAAPPPPPVSQNLLGGQMYANQPSATANMTTMQNPYVFGGYGAPPSMPYAGMATPQIPSIMGMSPQAYYGGSAQVGMADPTQRVS